MSSAASDKPDIGSKRRGLLRVESFSRKRYKLIFLLALAALVSGAWMGSKLELESNLLALVPQGNVQVDTLREALEEFGSIDYLMVLIEAHEEAGPDELEDFADLFAPLLEEQSDLVEFVEHRFQIDRDFLELFYENALLFLPPEKLPEIAEKLTDDAIRRRIQENRSAMASPTAAFTQELLAGDPLGLMPMFLNRLAGNRGVLQIDLSDGYYLARDGRNLIMLVKPTGPSQDLEFDRALMTMVREAEARAFVELADELEIDDATQSGVRVRYGGNYAVAVEEAKLIQKDVRFNLLFSLAAVSMLYWLCYRRFAALLYSSVPLLVGQALTFSVAFLVLGGLNAASAAFTALLMGLGTDFVIVVYARYVEERQKGRSLAEATELMIGETGLGVFTGAITSAGTFYAMCISQFRGLFDLGFLIGSGILLCAVAIVFMLPAMIKWNEGVRKRKVDAVKKLHLQSFLLEYLIPFSAQHRKLVLGGMAVLTIASLYAATQLTFDDTSKVLRSNRSEAYKVQQDIGRVFGASLSYMMAIADAPTQEEAIALTEKIAERVAPFQADGTVGSVDSVLTYLPPDAQQREILRTLQADTEGLFDADRVRATFLHGVDDAGFRQEAFSDFLGRLDGFLGPETTIGLEDLEGRGLKSLVNRYVARNEDGVRIVTYLYLADPRWRRQAPPGLVDALVEDDAGIVVTGTNIVSREFRRIFLTEAPRAVILGLIVVFALLWIDFRSFKLTAIAMTQLICGVILMLGLMKLADIISGEESNIGHLNYVNAFVATMILGVGIDYSIHLMHRLSLSNGRIEPGVLETGKAVVLAALTNIAGFGTLVLGNYPALRSFGLVAMFGSVACLFTALTLVPALMARPDSTASARGD